ncbi:arginine deiminase-related protein [Pseudoalteromonas sp. S554]|uniref:arginine deiminase-related protein n=1 Tax=Pseudoalteromonas sp. S554 TaxID=2066516 RepID=UPI0020174E81|nr:arginine deiminase-related protein [Pseudoalteromonas sp. S554]
MTHADELLQNEGVHVHLLADEHTPTPDSVFTNTCIYNHQNGELIIYTMFVENRRLE